MSATAKNKSASISITSSAELFGQLGKMFADPDLTWQTQKIRALLGKSVLQMRDQISGAEMEVLRKVVRELAKQIERLVPVQDSSVASTPDIDADAWRRAQHDDAVGQHVLDAAARRKPMAMSTRQSIRAGDGAVAQAETAAAATTAAARIAKGELISSGELQRALDVKRQAISNAVKTKRLFAIVGPSGDNYYPAYFADERLDRRKLEQVAKALGSLPAPSKHHFFTSKSSMLGETPLQALRKGREADVLAAAAGFAER
ncbi:hypothetical protein [Janthinobacterium sp. PSPC3-1]|uniref:hypothetical protein n=1 Tax=Janthinobacterium sp. PSPC3-1 TaxID=2804653 RepID=UPI003CF60181